MADEFCGQTRKSRLIEEQVTLASSGSLVHLLCIWRSVVDAFFFRSGRLDIGQQLNAVSELIGGDHASADRVWAVCVEAEIKV